MVGSNVLTQRLLKLWLPLLLYGIFLLFPFAWMLIVSLKPDQLLLDTRRNPFALTSVTLSNYRYLLTETEFPRWIWNTMVVTVGATLLSLACSILIGYALGRFQFRGGNTIGIAIFLLYLVPPTLLFIPLSRVVADLGLRNTWWAMVLVYPSFTIPFCTWLLMGFFKSIPRDIEEQAMIDGYSRLGAIWRTVLPVSIPGLLTVIVFSFALTMHEFVYALAFVTSSDQKTISIGVTTELIRGDVFFWQSLMAAAALVAIPVALIYNVFLDRFIAGFTLGAVKG